MRRLSAQLDEARSEILQRGYEAKVVSRSPSKVTGVQWPPDEILILVEIETALDWVLAQKTVLESCGEIFAPTQVIYVTPCRKGHTLGSLQGQVMSEVFPSDLPLDSWFEALDVALISELVSKSFVTAATRLGESSAVIGNGSSWPLKAAEVDFLENRTTEYVNHRTILRDRQFSDESGVIAQALELLGEMEQMLEEQHTAIAAGRHASPEIALAFIAQSKQQRNQLWERIAFYRYLLLEFDVDPLQIWERVDQAVQRIVANQGHVIE